MRGTIKAYTFFSCQLEAKYFRKQAMGLMENGEGLPLVLIP